MRKQIKKLAAISTVAVLSLSSVFTSLAAGWQQDEKGWWYQNEDGSYPASQWLQSPESGKWYYFDETGYMMAGRTTPDGYVVGADGAWTGGNQDEEVSKKMSTGTKMLGKKAAAVVKDIKTSAVPTDKVIDVAALTEIVKADYEANNKMGGVYEYDLANANLNGAVVAELVRLTKNNLVSNGVTVKGAQFEDEGETTVGFSLASYKAEQ